MSLDFEFSQKSPFHRLITCEEARSILDDACMGFWSAAHRHAAAGVAAILRSEGAEFTRAKLAELMLAAWDRAAGKIKSEALKKNGKEVRNQLVNTRRHEGATTPGQSPLFRRVKKPRKAPMGRGKPGRPQISAAEKAARRRAREYRHRADRRAETARARSERGWRPYTRGPSSGAHARAVRVKWERRRREQAQRAAAAAAVRAELRTERLKKVAAAWGAQAGRGRFPGGLVVASRMPDARHNHRPDESYCAPVPRLRRTKKQAERWGKKRYEKSEKEAKKTAQAAHAERAAARQKIAALAEINRHAGITAQAVGSAIGALASGGSFLRAARAVRCAQGMASYWQRFREKMSERAPMKVGRPQGARDRGARRRRVGGNAGSFTPRAKKERTSKRALALAYAQVRRFADLRRAHAAEPLQRMRWDVKWRFWLQKMQAEQARLRH